MASNFNPDDTEVVTKAPYTEMNITSYQSDLKSGRGTQSQMIPKKNSNTDLDLECKKELRA